MAIMKRFLFLILVWLCALSLYAAQDVFVVNGTEVKDFTGQELVGKTVAKYRIETTDGKVIHYIDLAENEKIVVVDTRTKKELNLRIRKSCWPILRKKRMAKRAAPGICAQ